MLHCPQQVVGWRGSVVGLAAGRAFATMPSRGMASSQAISVPKLEHQRCLQSTIMQTHKGTVDVISGYSHGNP